MTKTRRWKTRKDRVRQRYWYGRKNKKKPKLRRKYSILVDEVKNREHSGYFDEFSFENGRRKNNEGYEFNPRRIRRFEARKPTWEDVEDISRLEKFGRKGEINIPKKKAEQTLKIASLVASVHPNINPLVAHSLDVVKFNINEDIVFGGKKPKTQKDITTLLKKEGFK